jgi:hypothetical protein
MHKDKHSCSLAAAASAAFMLALVACKTTETGDQAGSGLKDSSSIQTMTRSGDNFEITCLDGSAQTVSITDFPNKDPREICPGVGYSECGQRVLYANGRELRSSNGAIYYPNGSIAITPDGKVRYVSGQHFSDASNNLFFGNGAPLLSQNASLMYPEGNTLRTANGAIFYPDNSPLALASGALRYPGNQRLSDESGNFFYSDDKSRRLKAGDSIYYKDGSLAKSGQSLFRPEDHKVTQSPIIIEEPIGDGAVVRGLLRFNLTPTQVNFLMDLPKLHPGVAARYESKKNAWYFRYNLSNADFPIVLTIDGKIITKTMYLKTGYANSTVIVDFTKAPFTCRMINTAVQSTGVTR